jgi:hypothetical protein
MYFSEVTDDIYTIADDESINKKNFDNINRNVDKNIFKNDFPQGQVTVSSPREIVNSTDYVNNEVKISQNNDNKITENKSSPIINDNKVKIVDNLSKPQFEGVKSIPNKPNFKFNGNSSNNNQKEKDDTLVLSSIIDENEHNRLNDKTKAIKNDSLKKNGLVYQKENSNMEVLSKDVVHINNNKNVKKKVKDESLDLSEILSDEDTHKNLKPVAKANDFQEKIKVKNEGSIKFHNNNHSISDISIHQTSKVIRNDNVINENNSMLTSKNNNTTNNISKISTKFNNGAGAVDGYIQKKVSQIETEFLSSKHHLEKMLLKEESNIIHYESKLEYRKVYDILKKQNSELVKSLEKMNNYMNTIIEGTKIAPKEVKQKKKNIGSKHSSEVDNKIIAVYKKEYSLINARLSQISEPQYLSKIDNILSELNKQISQLEIDNKRAKVEQKQSEAKIGKNSKLTDIDGNSEIKKINYDYEHFQKQSNIINLKINKNRDDIDAYNHRIEEFNQNFLKLVEISSYYNISEYDIKQIEEISNSNKNDSNSLDDKKSVLMKKIEIIKKVKEQNKNKHENAIKNNVAKLLQLENSKQELVNELREKSKIATGNNIKLREFYDRQRNHNVSTIMKDLNLLNETMEKNNQNSTNYSTGNLARRQVLSRISEEIGTDDSNINSNNRNIHLTPIEEKERDLEETVGKNKLEELVIKDEIKQDQEEKQINKMEDVIIHKNPEVKEKVPVIDKYGIKPKPNFKIGKTEDKDKTTSNNEKSPLKQDSAYNKYEEMNTEINIKKSAEEKQKIIEEKPPENNKIINQPTENKSSNIERVNANSHNSAKQINNSFNTEDKVLKSETKEEKLIDENGSRRKKPAIIQQSNTNGSFLPIIENREAKEKAEREKIRGKWSETENTELSKNEEINIKNDKIQHKFMEKQSFNDLSTIKSNEETNKKETIQEAPKQDSNVPLFLQNYSNRTIIESKKTDANLITDKSTSNIYETRKEDNAINSDLNKIDKKNDQKTQNDKTKQDEKKTEVKQKKEKKTEKIEINENKPSLFSNIFLDDDEDITEKKQEAESSKAHVSKKKEDFDKLFAKDIQPKNNKESSHKNANKELIKPLNTKLDLANKQLNPKENEKTNQFKKKNPIEDLDDLII